MFVCSVLQFLDDLDSFSPTPGQAATAGPSSAEPTAASHAPDNPAEAQSVLDFLDELTQRSATPVAPVPPRASLDRKNSRGSLRANTPNAGTASSQSNSPAVGLSSRPTSGLGIRAEQASPISPAVASSSAQHEADSPAAAAGGAGAWGWSSVWSSASNVMKQAREVAEENLAKTGVNLPQSVLAISNSQQENAKKWTEGVLGMVKGVDVEKLSRDLKATGLKTFNDIVNAVAPPIAEHEVIEVWLSHDMLGYEGVETLVYRAMAKVRSPPSLRCY